MGNIMKYKFKQLTIIVASTLCLQACVPTVIMASTSVASHVITDPRTVGTQFDDEALKIQITKALDKDVQLRKESSISVVSYNAEVLLIGRVPTEEVRQLASNIVKGIKNVRHVYNELRIGQDISASQVLKDTSITSQIKSKLIVTPNIISSNVKVITENGEVFLIGNVFPEQAKIIVEVARHIDGVKKVINALHFAPRINKNEEASSKKETTEKDKK